MNQKYILFIIGIIVISLGPVQCINIENSSSEINFDENDSIWIKSFFFFKRNMKKCLLKEYAHDTSKLNQRNLNTNYIAYKNWNQKSNKISIISNLTNTWIKCFKATSLKLFDGITKLKQITLMNGIQLIKIPVKYYSKSDKQNYERIDDDINATGSEFNFKKDINIDLASSQLYDHHKNVNGRQMNKSTENQQLQETTEVSSYWLEDILNKINETLTTHVLQINFSKLDNQNVDEDAGKVTGRHRHRRNNMMLAMLFGVTAMGAIIVPVGFQFLAVVAGKALLLSKMALLLASISSLRKIASSGVHYGLYHIPEHYGGYFDRGDGNNYPRYPRMLNE